MDLDTSDYKKIEKNKDKDKSEKNKDKIEESENNKDTKIKLRDRKPISLYLPPKDNFVEWYNYYSPVLYHYYLDFKNLFESTTPPNFKEFVEYCYNNTKCYYNRYKNTYECRILNNF